MQPHRIARDRDLDRDRQQRPPISAIVEHVLEAVGAVGHGGDAGAHLALGVVQQRLAGREHRRGAVLRAQRLEALHAEPVRRHLRAQIGQALARHLAVEQDQVQHVLLQLAGAVEPDRRDAQAFLVDVGVAAIGEIGVVRDIGRPGDERAVDEDRLGEHDVGQMRAAAGIGVVADEDVARPDVLGGWRCRICGTMPMSCRDASGCARPGTASSPRASNSAVEQSRRSLMLVE